MTYLFKLARRTARLRALSLIALGAALAGCDTDRLTNSSEQGVPASEPVTLAPAFAVGFRGGLPFGTWALPTSMFGDVYNGAVRNIDPSQLLSELAAIKARGGRVILAMAGNEENYKDAANFNSYIDDGTVMGHYIIDEPNDPANWGNQPVPGTMVEELAAYSKSIWPKMATVVRVEPTYLAKWTGYHALDAAWAQWVTNRGDPADYIRGQAAEAQKIGLNLVTGLNIIKGAPNQQPLSASTVLSAGSALLANDYPCAFISWEYDADYLARSDIKSAMGQLSNKAEAHSAHSCLRGGTTPVPLPGIKGIALTATRVVINNEQIVYLKWAGALTTMVDVYRNGAYRTTTRNDGLAKSYPQRAGQYTFKICDAGKTRCSNNSTVTIK
jgi:hypothetical protein